LSLSKNIRHVYAYLNTKKLVHRKNKKPQYLDQNRPFSKQKSLNSKGRRYTYRLLVNCQVSHRWSQVVAAPRNGYGKSGKELYDCYIAHLLLMVGNIRARLDALEI
jgi:glucuronate isomerase